MQRFQNIKQFANFRGSQPPSKRTQNFLQSSDLVRRKAFKLYLNKEKQEEGVKLYFTKLGTILLRKLYKIGTSQIG